MRRGARRVENTGRRSQIEPLADIANRGRDCKKRQIAKRGRLQSDQQRLHRRSRRTHTSTLNRSGALLRLHYIAALCCFRYPPPLRDGPDCAAGVRHRGLWMQQKQSAEGENAEGASFCYCQWYCFSICGWAVLAGNAMAGHRTGHRHHHHFPVQPRCACQLMCHMPRSHQPPACGGT